MHFVAHSLDTRASPLSNRLFSLKMYPHLTLSSVFLLSDLFNAAFVSCWSELNEDQQDELIRSIELALTSQDIAEVTQTLLNLAEFMEHSDKVEVLWSNSYQHCRCLVYGKGVKSSHLLNSLYSSCFWCLSFYSGSTASERWQWHCAPGGTSCQVSSICQGSSLQGAGISEGSHPSHSRVSYQVGPQVMRFLLL